MGDESSIGSRRPGFPVRLLTMGEVLVSATGAMVGTGLVARDQREQDNYRV